MDINDGELLNKKEVYPALIYPWTVICTYMRMWTQDNTRVTARRSAHNMSKRTEGVDAVHKSCPQRPTIEM